MSAGLDARLSVLEETITNIERTWDDVAARCARVRECLAEDERRRSYRRGYEVIVRETSTPAFGRALGDSLVGQVAQPTAPARESNAHAESNPFVGAMNLLFDAKSGCSRKLTWRDAMLMDHLDRQVQAKQPRKQATAEGRRLADAWERDCGGRRP